jgi:hypothetical protein
MFSSKEQVEKLEKKVDELQSDITSLHAKFDKLESLLQKEVVPSCNKMGSHIDFVECVYNKVQSPLGYLVGKVNYMIGGSPADTQSTHALPDIERPRQDESNDSQ